MKPYILSYKEYGEMMDQFCFKLKQLCLPKDIHIFGPERGGLPIAVHVSHHLAIPFSYAHPNNMVEPLLVVDDVADSGHTLNLIKSQRIGFDTWYATLFWKPCCSFPKRDLLYIKEVPTEQWIMFPWEDKTRDEKKCSTCFYGTLKESSWVVGGQMTFLGRVPCKRVCEPYIECGFNPQVCNRDPDSVCSEWKEKGG